MDDRAGPLAVETLTAAAGVRIVFALADARFALPVEAVEAVAPPPPLVPVPHAAPALLGVGNFAGNIVPVVDLARLLDGERAARRYDGSGEIIRLRIPGGSAGIWVDRAERLVRGSPEGAEGLSAVTPLDPTALVVAALAAPPLGAVMSAPLGEVADRALPAAATAIAEPFILVEAAGKRVLLRRERVAELVETVPWARMPRSPAGLLGVALLRGAALPVLSLAALLGLPDAAAPSAFAAIELGGRRALLGVDRIVGLRLRARPDGADGSPERIADDGEPFDLAAALPDELRRIVLGFAASGEDGASGAAADPGARYLTFAADGQDFAVPIGGVDRVVGPQELIRLPRSAEGDGAPTAGAIELRGQIVPVAAWRTQVGLGADAALQPGAYVILREAGGLAAIGVDHVKRVVALRERDIAPPPAEHALIAGVARPEDGAMLRVLAPAGLWSAGR